MASVFADRAAWLISSHVEVLNRRRANGHEIAGRTLLLGLSWHWCSAAPPPPPSAHVKLAVVAVGSLVMAGLAVVGVMPAYAQTVSLASSSVTDTTATLTISGHTTAWYHKQTAPSAGTCSSVIAAGTDTASLTSLATGTDHTYTAYSDSTCTTANELASASFTTAGVVLSRPSLIAPEGRTATYKVSLATLPSASVTVTLAASGSSDSDITFDTDSVTTGNQTTLTFTTTNWSTAQTVTVAAAEESDTTDKAYGTATITHTADSGYHSTTTDLAVSEGDNDVCQGTTAVGGSTVTSGGLVDDCNTLLAAKSMLAGTSTYIDNWSTSLAIGSWTAISAGSRVTSFNLMSFGNLEGMIPNTIGDLTGLTVLRLHKVSGEGLTGPIPASIGNLTALTEMDLGFSSLTGSIPASIGNLTNLTALRLDSSKLSGPIPPSLGNLTRLTTLTTFNNSLSGSIPASFAKLTSLTNLEMFNNNLTGCVPANLINFVNAGNVADNDRRINPQSTGDLAACDGLALSKVQLSVTEGSTATYTVRLSTAPTAPVTVTLTNAGDNSITIDTDTNTADNQNTLTFTATDWTTAQTVTLSAAQDDDNTNGTAPIIHTAASTDTAYNITVTVTATEADDDVRLSSTSVTGTTATLRIHNHATAWYHKQTAPSVGTCSSVITAGTSTASLTSLTPGTEHAYTAYSDSTCTTANALASVSFTTAGIVLSRPALIAPEGGNATYTLRLASAPKISVTITAALSGNSDNDITFDTDATTSGNQTTLTFTTANWSTAQTVTVAAAEESDATDKAYGTATITHTASPGYHNLSADLAVSEGDNDVCQGTTAVGGSTVTSGGLVDDCNTLLAAKSMLAGTSTLIDDWSTSTAIGSWDGITIATNRVSQIELGAATPLDGMVPNTIGDLTELTSILLGSVPNAAQLTGPIPASIGSLTKLTYLDIGINDLSGPIPASIGNLPNLTTILLDDNLLSGPIPTSLGNLTKLGIVWLNDNRLSGPIPNRLDSLTNITSLRLYNNQLSGCVPPNLLRFVNDSSDGDATKWINPQDGGDLSACDGMTVSTARVSVPEGSTATYTLRLSTAPTAAVTVTLSRTGDTDITIDTNTSATGNQNTLTFTATNWTTAQTVTLSAGEDMDNISSTATITHTTSSNDTKYNGVTSTVSASETDNDNLSATNITHNSATLTLANHNTNWWLKRTEPTDSTCAAQSTNYTHNLTNLDAATTYTYKAYSNTECTTELDSITFTTLEVTLTAGAITHNSATLTLANHNTNWWLKRTEPTDSTCAAQSTNYTHNLTNLDAATTYTYKAYSNTECTTELDSITFTTDVYRALPAPRPTPAPTDLFDDDDGSIWEASINRVVAAGITNGCDDTRRLFCPDQPVTRAEMALFLQRALKLPIPADAKHFKDSEGFAQDAIAAIAAAGITLGCNDDGTFFCPSEPVTRAEMALFLQRALKLPIPADAKHFKDSEGFAQDAIAAIAAAGITRGCDTTGARYCPDKPVTRGQMAVFLARALKL